jgi:hypothetical protein
MIGTDPEHPGKTADAGRQVGDDAGISRSQVGGQGRAAVEAEPAKPQENGSEDDVGRVMGFVRETLGAITAALTEIYGNGEGSSTRDDMDRGTSGEIETAEDEDPTLGIPCPVGDWVVNDCGPDENEDHEWAEATALCDGTDRENGSDDVKLGINKPTRRYGRT